MAEINAKKLSRFGLTKDASSCLVEYENENGGTDRLAFPSTQLDEVLGLLLQLKTIYAQKTEGGDKRSVLVADQVGVLVQPDAAVFDFIVGGAPITFAIPTDMAVQLMQILQARLPAPVAKAES
jgi:hypothetical protein